MYRFYVFVLCMVASLVATNQGKAASLGFWEDFASDNANWLYEPGNAPQTFVDVQPAGGPDGGSYAEGTFNFINTVLDDSPIIFRGEILAPGIQASDGAFFGDWIVDRVTKVTMSVRHDARDPTTSAPLPLVFFGRVGAPGAQGAIFFQSGPVFADVWAPVEFNVQFGDPSLMLEGPPTPGFYNTVFSDIRRVTLGFFAPPELVGQDVDVNFGLDKVFIVPEPSAVATLGLAAAGLLLARRRVVGGK